MCTKKGCHDFMAPLRRSISVSRLPTIALSAGATATTTAATGTLLHRFRFIDR
jgi:hypothetical protein